MTDWSTFSYGGAVYPLTPSTSNTLLRDADPSLYFAIDFFASVLTTYLGARLATEIAKAPPITTVPAVVAYVVPFDPSPYLTEGQFKFPLLAVYRSKDILYEEKTSAWPHRVQEWVVEYTLPPLTQGQMERIGSMLKAAGDVLHDRIETMFDPSYASGLQVWRAAGLEAIKLVSGTFGRWDNGVGLSFPTWKALLEVKERVGTAPGELSAFAGVDPAVHLASPTQPVVTDIADNVVTFIDPTTLPGIVSVWLPEGATLGADGVSIATVPDVTGSANALLAGGTAPRLVPAQFTDFKGARKPAIRFDGLASSLAATVAALANDSSRTVVAFVRLNDTAKRSSIVGQTLASDTGAHSLAIEANTAGTAGGLYGVFADGSSYDSPVPTNGGGWHVIALQITASTNGATIAPTVALSVDGSTSTALTQKSGAGTWNGMATANQIVVGALPGISGTFASCDVGPVLAFNATQTVAQLSQIVAFCKQWAGFS